MMIIKMIRKEKNVKRLYCNIMLTKKIIIQIGFKKHREDIVNV